MESFLGEAIPKLGFGLMRLPKIGDEIDIEQVAQMADAFFAAGFTYFDTSWAYPGSEEAFAKAVVSRYPRERYQIASKCPAWRVRTAEEARAMLGTSLERTGVGYFDYYLLHNLGANRIKLFDDWDLWTWAREQKEKGLIRHLGFSFHDTAAELEKILRVHPEAEFVQLQINYADWDSPTIEARKCYELCRDQGKPVIVMEPLKGGSLTHLPPDVMKVFAEADPRASLASWGVRYGASLDGVITVLSGMSSLSQMRDNLSYMKDFKPLSDDERVTIEEARKLLEGYRSVPCTSCGYCTEVCAENVAIPGIFEALNWYEMYHDMPLASYRYNFNTAVTGLKPASACVECGSCEEACPQNIEIRKALKRAMDIFGE